MEPIGFRSYGSHILRLLELRKRSDRKARQILLRAEGESKGPDPPNATVKPLRNSRPYLGTINHWFPLIRPYYLEDHPS